MSTYSKQSDVKSPHYQGMGIEWHEQAKEYIDNMIIRNAGYDPDDLDTVPFVVRELSVAYAMEMFSASQIRQSGDFWNEQFLIAKERRNMFERRFNPTVVFENLETKDKGRQGGVSARTYRR